MKKVLFLTTFALIATASAKNCKSGQPCGGSCISWSKTCHIGTPSTPTNNINLNSEGPKDNYRTYSNTIATTKTNVNLHNIANVESTKITTFEAKTRLNLHFCDEKWCYVSSLDYKHSGYLIREALEF